MQTQVTFGLDCNRSLKRAVRLPAPWLFTTAGRNVPSVIGCLFDDDPLRAASGGKYHATRGQERLLDGPIG